MGRTYPEEILCQKCERGTIKHHCQKNQTCNWYGPCETCDHITVMTRFRLGQVALRFVCMHPVEEPKE